MNIPLEDALRFIRKLPVVWESHREYGVIDQRFIGRRNLASKHVAYGLEKALLDNGYSSAALMNENEVHLITGARERI